MSGVKRFTRTCDCVTEVPYGEYVLYADYDALAQQLAITDALCEDRFNEIAELREQLGDRKEKHLASTRLAIAKSQLAKEWHAKFIEQRKQLAASEARERLAIQAKDMAYWTLEEAQAQLAARDKQLAKALDMLKSENLVKHIGDLCDNAEQRAFEEWLSKGLPSGDCAEINAKWLDSSDYDDFIHEWEELTKAAAFLTTIEQGKENEQ